MGHSPREVAARFDEIADFAELGDFLNVRVKHYSSGMGLRLGFAIAVAWEPEVLLVDEVLAVADAHFQHRAYDRLRALQERGSAIMLVSHEMSAVRAMCSRAIWLDGGKIRADGRTDAVIEQYLAAAG